MINLNRINLLSTYVLDAISQSVHQKSCIKSVAQPVLAMFGVIFGVISGYEIGHTTVLKARGFWHANLYKPAIYLTAALGLAVLSASSLAAVLAVATISSVALGALNAIFENGSVGKLDFDAFQKIYGNKPAEISLISPNEFSKIAKPTQKEAGGLVWYLTKVTCERGESFTEGNFVLEGKKAEYIYDQLSQIDGTYTRISSHFKGRIPKNIPQCGLDFKGGALPVGKRTILFGLANTHDGKKVLFIKPEYWGADHRIRALMHPEKLKHFINHSLHFLHSLYVKFMRPGYDDRPGTAKERIPHSWKNIHSIYGWAELSNQERQALIDQGLASQSWIYDCYRTGQESYTKIKDGE